MVDGVIYVIGGVNWWLPTPMRSTVEAYDSVTDTWSEKADMSAPKAWLTTAAVNGRIYAIGGMRRLPNGDWTILDDVEEYDRVRDVWTKKQDMPAPRAFLGAAVVDDGIYVTGGFGVEFFLPRVEIYAPAKDRWNNGNLMPMPLETVKVGVDGKIYVIGGENASPLVEIYDTTTRKWSVGTQMPTGRNRLSTSVVNGKIYAIGGANADLDAAYKTVEVYDPQGDPNEPFAVSPQGRLATMWGEIKERH